MGVFVLFCGMSLRASRILFWKGENTMNEILLIGSLIVLYGSVLIFYKLFGNAGLYCYSAIATVLANVEVLLLIDAFGMEMTLGNILFATTFIVTDILSETESKEAAQKAVLLGVGCSVLFLFLSQSWLLYVPSASDWAAPAFHAIFKTAPRTMLSSLIVYTVTQWIDVLLYHFWWEVTRRRSGDSRRFLWLRNNVATLISQLINTVLFTFCAFWGVFDLSTICEIIVSSYSIFIVTSLLDTPVIYLARHIHDKKMAD